MSALLLGFLVTLITLFVLLIFISITLIVKKLDIIHVLVNSRLSTALKEIAMFKRVVILLAKQQGVEDPILQEVIDQTLSIDSEENRKSDKEVLF